MLAIRTPLYVHHHHHPNVSFSNLGRVHSLYRQHGLLHEAAVFNGYGAYLRHLQRGGRDVRDNGQAGSEQPKPCA
jgi:fatty acid desaturase